MPTAVESVARLGAVLVQLPLSAAPALHVDPNGLENLGGRSGIGIGTRAELHTKTAHTQQDRCILSLAMALIA